MSYQVFARKYRPQNFDSVVGQEHITQTLKNAIEQNRLAHAYLFVGPRGVGKTSTARILAKALNCEKGPTVNPCGVCDACKEISQGISLDVLEIDGASNNGVDQVRELRDNVRFAPTRGKFKIYIIDEVHMLTPAAFNALLKTLEEPPAHVKFIFATTEPQKVLPTILSRCQRFDLRRIPTALIADHLQFIATQEKITLEPAAAQAISKGAEGGLRDAESMLDQLVAFCGEKILEEDVLSIFGFTAQQTVSDLCGHILSGSSPEALAVVSEQAEGGKDLSRLMGDLISHLRNLLVLKADPEGLRKEIGAELIGALQSQADQLEVDRLLELIEQFAAAEARMKWAPNKKLHFEIAVIKAIQTLGQTTLSQIIETIAALRDGGNVPAPKAPAPRPAAAAAGVPAAVTPKPPLIARPTFAEDPMPAPLRAAPVVPAPVPAATIPGEQAKEEIAASQPASILEPDELHIALLRQIQVRRPIIRTWIEAGKIVALNNGFCVFAFPPEESMPMETLMRPANVTFLEGLLSELAGRQITLKFEKREGLIVETVNVPAPVEAVAADPMEEFKNDPLIRKALEIFKGEIQSAI